MSLLDDLKNQVEQRKAEEDAEQKKQQELETAYRDRIRPVMMQVFTYLSQLVEHVNFLKQDIQAGYPFAADGGSQLFHQRNYKLAIDSNNEPKTITLRFFAELDEPVEFVMEGEARVERIAENLKSYRIPHHCKEYKDDNYRIYKADVRVEGPIVITFVLQADMESSTINLMYNNFEAPGTRKHRLKPEQFTEAYMDQLGKFILRQNPEFMKLDISDSEKEQIRLKLQEEKIKREAELAEMERLRQEEEAREEEQSWKHKLQANEEVLKEKVNSLGKKIFNEENEARVKEKLQSFRKLFKREE